MDASDNVMLANVRVTILDVDGKVLEQGQAMQAEANWWEYISSNKGKVVAEAWDLAGNEVRKEGKVVTSAVRVSETIVEVLRSAHIVPMPFRENDTA